MSWEIDPIRPPAGPPPKHALNPSPALGRLFGAVGFMSLAMVTYAGGRRLLDLPPDPWDQPVWDFKTVALVVAASLAGFFGLLFGFGLGLSIRVTDERTDCRIAAVWHYLANGSIAAFFVWSVAFVVLLGKDESKEFVRAFGPWPAAGATLGLSIAACVAVAVVFSAMGLINPRGHLRLLPSLVLVLPFTLPLAYGQFAILGLTTWHWVAVGVLIPAWAIFASGPLIGRDLRSGRQLRDGHTPAPARR